MVARAIDPSMMDRLFNGKLDITKYDDSRLWWNIWSKIDKTDDCWNWTGAKESLGYGKVRIQYKTFLIHRIVWIICEGPLSIDDVICHKCNNPSCVKPDPDHIYKGTHLTNAQDRQDGLRQLGWHPRTCYQKKRGLK